MMMLLIFVDIIWLRNANSFPTSQFDTNSDNWEILFKKYHRFQSITYVRSHAIGFNTCMTWPKMFQCDGSLSLKLTLSVPRSSHVFSSIAPLNCSLLKSDNVRGQISGHQMNASVYLNPETSVLTCLRTKTEEKDCV